jgi:hypothetical protein
LSNISLGNAPSNAPAGAGNDALLAEGRLEKEKENRIIEKTNQRLRDLSPTDEIYEAMENFLLGNPESQLQMLGTKEELKGKGDEAKSKNEDLIARAQYETMAKVAIYKQDPELVKESLELASEVTNPSDRHAKMQRTIEGNLDEIMKIARDYYQTKEEIKAETEAEVAKVAEKQN